MRSACRVGPIAGWRLQRRAGRHCARLDRQGNASRSRNATADGDPRWARGTRGDARVRGESSAPLKPEPISGTALTAAALQELHVKPLLGEVLEAVLAERPADPRDYIANFFSSATNASVQPEQPAAEPRRPPQPDPEPEPAEGENTSLWVGHLPDEMLVSGIDKTESELRRLFSAYGVVAGVSVRKKDAKNRSWAFVTFTTDDGAQAALDCETEVTGADGAATVLLVRQAEVAANLNAKAGEHPPGALRSMWAAQTTRVLQNLRTPMQDVLDTLHDIAGGHPAIAERLGEVASTLTSTEDLWAVEEKGEAEAGGLRARNRRFSEVTDESIRAFLLSHSNEQLHESQAFSQELTRKRKIARAARQTAEAQEAAPDQNLDVARVLPDIGQDARVELQRWAAKIDSWEFDVSAAPFVSSSEPERICACADFQSGRAERRAAAGFCAALGVRQARPFLQAEAGRARRGGTCARIGLRLHGPRNRHLPQQPARRRHSPSNVLLHRQLLGGIPCGH